VQLNNVFK